MSETETPETAENAETSENPAEPETSQRSEEHTSELQSRGHLVCRLLLEIKNIKYETEGKYILKVLTKKQQGVFVTFFILMIPFLIIGLLYFFILARLLVGVGVIRLIDSG